MGYQANKPTLLLLAAEKSSIKFWIPAQDVCVPAGSPVFPHVPVDFDVPPEQISLVEWEKQGVRKQNREEQVARALETGK